jgi:hypothetical protein
VDGYKERRNEGECGGRIVSIHENRRMKSVEICSKKVGGGKREKNGGGKSN